MTNKPITIALAQINVTVGDLVSNTQKIIEHIHLAKKNGADLVVFPELVLTGYPPEDLLLRPGFLTKTAQSLQTIATHCTTVDAIIGLPLVEHNKRYNTAAHLSKGQVSGYYHKQCLPNTGVFDEKRYFEPGNKHYCLTLHDYRIAIVICEDMWTPTVCNQLADEHIDAIVSLNASPYEIGKPEARQETLLARTKQTNCPVFYCNLAGGQDELIFDGGSFACHPTDGITALLPRFEEAICCFTLEGQSLSSDLPRPNKQSTLSEIHDAIVLGIRDYVTKNHFPGVLIGLSGGIDSAVTLALACQAVGSDNVQVVMMPSRYTADMSIEDAKTMAATCQVDYQCIDIDSSFQSLSSAVATELNRYPPSTAQENLQARCRGTLLMAISNASNKLVLTTGNRSEMAVGYATLYGDMAGGLAVLKDLPKTDVYALAEFINRDGTIIPQRIIDRPPSAELAPDQKDDDNLPPYNELDQIIQWHIDEALDGDDIVAKGFPEATVKRVIHLIRLAEYKRRQSPPGIRLRHTSFGKDRRYPITSGYRF